MHYKKKNKYGNKKTTWNGIKFDSKLEEYAYRLMEAHGIEFEFQVPIELIPEHRINGKAVRKTEVIVDFVIKTDEKVIYMDTKGFATQVAKLKYKMLGYKKLQEEANFEIHWLKSNKAVLEFVNNIKKDKDE